MGGYLQFPERCKIVALVDIVPEKAQAMKEKYGLMKSVPHFYEKTTEAAELSGEITLGSGYGARSAQ